MCVQIGGLNSDGTVHKFVGDMDELRVYNYVMTQTQIMSFKTGQQFGFNTATGCLLYYKFSETSGNAIDSCGGNAANQAVWTGSAAAIRGTTANPLCVPGYFASYTVVLTNPTTRVGVSAKITVYMIDQNGIRITQYCTSTLFNSPLSSTDLVVPLADYCHAF